MGIGDLGLGPIPNPQSPIIIFKENKILNKNKNKIIKKPTKNIQNRIIFYNK